MERKCLVNLPFSQGLHVVHLVLTELVRHLLRGRACWQLAVRRPFLLAGFALTIKEEVLLVESLMSGKGKVTHPEELFSCRDTQLAENRTIVVCNLLPLREFVSRENSHSPFLMFLVVTRNISLPMLILTVFGLQSLLK